MTAGQEALREAARLEAARVYGGVVREHKQQPVSVLAAVAEAELSTRECTAVHTPEDADIVTAIRAGMTNSQIIHFYGATYAEVRAARKRVMSEGAA